MFKNTKTNDEILSSNRRRSGQRFQHDVGTVNIDDNQTVIQDETSSLQFTPVKQFQLTEQEINALKSPNQELGSMVPQMPAFDPKKNYYDLYWDMYLQNESVMNLLNTESSERDSNLQKILSIETFYLENLEKLKSERYLHNGRKRHNRRCAGEIERGFQCPYDSCTRVYGSEGSLNLHMKIKHNGGNKTDREKVAKQLVYAKVSGTHVPTEIIAQQINLPPGSIEQAAEQVGVDVDDKIKKMEQELRRQNMQKEVEMKKAEMMKVKKMQPENKAKSPNNVLSNVTNSYVFTNGQKVAPQLVKSLSFNKQCDSPIAQLKLTHKRSSNMMINRTELLNENFNNNPMKPKKMNLRHL